MTERSLTDMAGLAARHRAEKRFRWYGIIAITISLGFLAVMVVSIGSRGIGAFSQTRIALSIHFDEAIVDPLGKRNTAELSRSNTNALIRASLNELFGQVQLPSERRALYALVSVGGAYELQAALEKRPNLVGQTKTMWLTASDDVDIFVKKGINPALDPALRRLKPNRCMPAVSSRCTGRRRRGLRGATMLRCRARGLWPIRSRIVPCGLWRRRRRRSPGCFTKVRGSTTRIPCWR